ncbi:MAG TPA: YidC/Oxa1 family membrane protein insertase [Candidatus Fimivicinus intestinavium]|nr:YidC/Oxa1 family membrane protein insertase [Candidatus Fimivicinus intestinavium]
MGILYTPFGFIFRIFYDLVSNYGLALFLFTLLFRLILLPSSISQQKGQAKQMRLQPKIKKIQEKYRGNQAKMNEEMQALYSREGYNPMSAGCLPMLIQLPVIFGLLGVIYYPIQYVLGVDADTVNQMTEVVQKIIGDASVQKNLLELQVFNHLDEVIAQMPALSSEIVEKLHNFHYTMFGIPLAATPSFSTLSHLGSASRQEILLLLIPLASGLSAMMSGIYTWVRQKQTNPEMAKNPMMGCTALVMPLFSLVIAFQFPAGAGIYWTISNLIAFAQMILLNYTHSPKKIIAKMMVEETINKRSKEENMKLVAQRGMEA